MRPGQQALRFYNHHYRSYCYLPLFLFEGLSGKFIAAVLRPGKRPKGAENTMIIGRVLKHLRAAWPETRIVLRGDGHFSNPELMALALEDAHTDFIFGMTGNSVLSGLAAPFLETKGSLNNNCAFWGVEAPVRQGAERGAYSLYATLFATQPGGMDRRSKMGSYC